MSTTEKNNRDSVIVAGLICLLVALFAMRAPFSASLWTDETISKWIVSDTVRDVFNRAILFQGQSPFYYLLLWIISQLFGAAESTLRLLSVVCCVMTAVLVYRMTGIFTKDRAVALLSVGALLCSDVFQDALLSARPYALAILFSTGSVVLLYGLIQSFSHARAMLFTFAMIATWYAHYLFAAIALAHVVTIFRNPTLRKRMVPWCLVGIFVCAPGVIQGMSLAHRSGGLSFASMPDLFGWVSGAMPIPVLVSVIVGVSLGLIWGGRFVIANHSRHAVSFLLPYIILPIVLFSAWSNVSGRSVWIPRYWSWQLPVLGVFVGVLLNSISGTRGRQVAFIVTALFFVLRISTQVRVVEDWRGVAHVLAQGTGDIVLYSGLIEAESGSGREYPEFETYLRIPLLVYGVQRPIQILGITQQEQVLADALKRATSFVAVRRESFGKRSPQYFTEIAEKSGIKLESIGNFGGVAVYQPR